MSIGITERVARLYSGQTFKGSAWLISPTHAVTARHCLITAGLIAEDLTLSFPSGGPTIHVSLIADNPDADVALLEVAIECRSGTLESRVLRLARRPLLQPHLHLSVAGHPGSSLNQLSAAFRIDWRVIDVNLPLPNGGPKHIYAQLGGPSVTGSSREDLKGLSGGPAWCIDDIDGADPFVAGMMLRVPALDNIFIVPFSALVGWHEIVDDAISTSPHRPDGPLCLELTRDGLVGWSSASASPGQSDILWGNASRVTSVSCRAKSAELGEDLFWALVRLIGHTSLPCLVADADEWKEAMRMQGIQTLASIVQCPRSVYRHSLAERVAEFETRDASALAEEIHAALDLWLLNKVNSIITGILNCSVPSVLDYGIDGALSDGMLQLWQDTWYPLLTGDAHLLRSVLVRLASHNEAVRVDGPALACVGKSIGPNFSMLMEPFIFALALAASGVDLAPASTGRGNLSLVTGGGDGHACGCERVKNQRISLSLPRSPTWGAALVLLPLMKEGFLGIYKKAQPMRQGGDKRPRIGEPGLPPVIVSSDRDFLVALGQGEAEVLAHVRSLHEELAGIIETRFGEEEAEKWKQRLKF